MDRASSGKSDPPCFKQDQIPLLLSSAAVSDLTASFRAHRNRHSELPAIFDRHELGTGNRDHLGTMIFSSSE
jgi:hypothetical protein